MGRLDNRVAIITGGARGLGKQMAITFAREGADIVVCDIVDMSATVTEVGKSGRKIVAVKADVSIKKDVAKLVATAIESFGKVDILVNNAATTHRGSLLELTEEAWDTVLDVNLRGPFFCIQAVAPHMIQRKYGKIINLSSIAGISRVLLRPAVNYAVSKAGIIKLTEVCARELGPYGINVNTLAPGLVVTEMTLTERTPAEVQEFVDERKKFAALGRTGTAQEIANLALFLASDESSFITGQMIAADGGS